MKFEIQIEGIKEEEIESVGTVLGELLSEEYEGSKVTLSFFLPWKFLSFRRKRVMSFTRW